MTGAGVDPLTWAEVAVLALVLVPAVVVLAMAGVQLARDGFHVYRPTVEDDDGGRP